MKTFIGLLLLIILIGCNPYKKLDNHPPLTSKDSLALALRCALAFPIDTVTVPGEVIRDTIIVEDTLRINSLLEYINTVLADGEVDSISLDSLVQEIRKTCTPKIQYIKETCTPKIITIDDHKEADAWRIKYTLMGQSRDNLKEQLTDTKIKLANKTKYQWGFWSLLVLILGVSGTYAYMKFKVPVKIT